MATIKEGTTLHYYNDAEDMFLDMFYGMYDQLDDEQKEFLRFYDAFEPYSYIVVNYCLIISLFENDVTGEPETPETFIRNLMKYKEENNL